MCLGLGCRGSAWVELCCFFDYMGCLLRGGCLILFSYLLLRCVYVVALLLGLWAGPMLMAGIFGLLLAKTLIPSVYIRVLLAFNV